METSREPLEIGDWGENADPREQRRESNVLPDPESDGRDGRELGGDVPDGLIDLSRSCLDFHNKGEERMEEGKKENGREGSTGSDSKREIKFYSSQKCGWEMVAVKEGQ